MLTSMWRPFALAGHRVQRAHDGVGGEHARQHVGERCSYLGGVLVARHAHDARDGLEDRVEPHAVAVGAALAEARERAVDDSGVHRAGVLKAQAEFGQLAGRHVLDDGVRLPRQGAHGVPARARLHVDGDALFRAVVRIKIILVLFPVLVTGDAARVVAEAGPLNLHHLGPHVGQHGGAERPRDDLGEIQHPETAQWRRSLRFSHLPLNGWRRRDEEHKTSPRKPFRRWTNIKDVFSNTYRSRMVPGAGLEPARPLGQGILSP